MGAQRLLPYGEGLWEKMALCSMLRLEAGFGADLEVQGKGWITGGNCESVN